jgi:hypothetical protein
MEDYQEGYYLAEEVGFFVRFCVQRSPKIFLDMTSRFDMMKLSKTLELVPAIKGDFYLSELPKDSSGCEAGSYLQWVETSLSAFSFGNPVKGGERDGVYQTGRYPRVSSSWSSGMFRLRNRGRTEKEIHGERDHR